MIVNNTRRTRCRFQREKKREREEENTNTWSVLDSCWILGIPMRNRRSSGVYHDLRIVIHSRITPRKDADPRAAGYLGRRKSGAYEIRFTDVFYASTIFPAAEIRGTISRLAREWLGCSAFSLSNGYAIFVCRALKGSSSLWPTCSPRREIKWFILRDFIWNARHIPFREFEGRIDSSPSPFPPCHPSPWPSRVENLRRCSFEFAASLICHLSNSFSVREPPSNNNNNDNIDYFYLFHKVYKICRL